MNGSSAVTAVVLAGGSPGDVLAVGGAVPSKALLPIGGRPMAAFVLDAVRRCEVVDHCVFVGPEEPSLRGLYSARVPGGERLADSLALGLGAAFAAGAEHLLVITADVPWVDGPVLDRFLAAARAPAYRGAALVYPIVARTTSEAAFPQQSRTYVRLRDGRFTGGNAVYLTRAGALRLLPLVDALYRARKNPVALAGLMGLGTVLGLLTGGATIAGLERRAGLLLGLEARALVSEDAAIAADVDSPAHVPGTRDDLLPTAPGGVT